MSAHATDAQVYHAGYWINRYRQSKRHDPNDHEFELVTSKSPTQSSQSLPSQASSIEPSPLNKPASQAPLEPEPHESSSESQHS